MNDETMNTDLEVVDTSEYEETDQNVEIIDLPPTGPSKGFVTLVVGGIAAVAVGATIAIKRHKRKKAERLKNQADEETIIDSECMVMDDEATESQETEESK